MVPFTLRLARPETVSLAVPLTVTLPCVVLDPVAGAAMTGVGLLASCVDETALLLALATLPFVAVAR